LVGAERKNLGELGGASQPRINREKKVHIPYQLTNFSMEINRALT
jgi:hypothetical protein